MNGLEETLCSMRLRENIGNPSRAEIYTQGAGQISTLNSQKLPILYRLQLSAEKGHLHRVRCLFFHFSKISSLVCHFLDHDNLSLHYDLTYFLESYCMNRNIKIE